MNDTTKRASLIWYDKNWRIRDGHGDYTSTYIPREFQDSLLACHWIHTVGGVLVVVVSRIAEEVQIEIVVFVLRGPKQSHAHDLLIELQALLGTLDADH